MDLSEILAATQVLPDAGVKELDLIWISTRKGRVDSHSALFIVRPAGRMHLEVQVLYGPCADKTGEVS